MRKLIVSVVFLFFLGCNSVEHLEKRWLGKDRSMLIAMRGTPDKTMSDGFGGDIYTYVKIHYSTYPELHGMYGPHPYDWPYYGYRRRYGYYHHQQIATGSSKTMFWIDPFGKIYKVSIAY